MTRPGQPDQPAEDSNEPPQVAHAPPQDSRPQPTSGFSLPRNHRAWLEITLSPSRLLPCQQR
jgi:hypothetical protein